MARGVVPPVEIGFGLEAVDGTSVKSPVPPMENAVTVLDPLFAT
jgi:hypothetical protein